MSPRDLRVPRAGRRGRTGVEVRLHRDRRRRLRRNFSRRDLNVRHRRRELPVRQLRVTLHRKTVRIDERAVLANRHLAGARIKIPAHAADASVDDEKAIAREREIRRLTRAEQRALPEELLRARHLHAVAGCAAADRAAENVLEDRARFLEADGVAVGDVVTNDVERVTFCRETARARVHRSENRHDLTPY